MTRQEALDRAVRETVGLLDYARVAPDRLDDILKARTLATLGSSYYEIVCWKFHRIIAERDVTQPNGYGVI